MNYRLYRKQDGLSAQGVVLVLLMLFFSGSCLGQTTGFYSYSAPNSNCDGPNIELYSDTEQSLCAAISNNFVQSTQCSWEEGYGPTASISTSLVRNWIVEGNPSGCFVIVNVVRTYGPPFNSSDSHDIYFDGGGGGQAMYALHFYVTDGALPCPCTNSPVADPINPATGGVYDTIVDVPAGADSFGFNRFYNSTDSGNANLSDGWRHSFSRSIQPKSSSALYRPRQSTQHNSPLYDDEESACTAGFAAIQSYVSTWANATANYINGVCTLTLGQVTLGTLPLFYDYPPTFPSILNTSIIAYTVTRDDGQLIRFTVNGTSIVAPPGINMKLQQTSSGYTLTDANDSVETYDANGKLLSITSRGGAVQMMRYDTSGRLSGVSDTFGHQLILSYDTLNRLITVTRQ